MMKPGDQVMHNGVTRTVLTVFEDEFSNDDMVTLDDGTGCLASELESFNIPFASPQ